MKAAKMDKEEKQRSIPVAVDEEAFIQYLADKECRSWGQQARFMIRQACMMDQRFEHMMANKALKK